MFSLIAGLSCNMDKSMFLIFGLLLGLIISGIIYVGYNALTKGK